MVEQPIKEMQGLLILVDHFIYDIKFQRTSLREFITNANGAEAVLSARRVKVDVLESSMSVALYARFRQEQPLLDLKD